MAPEPYRPRGGSLKLFRQVLADLQTGGQHEYLHDGPAGTGKSRAAMELFCFLCEEYPGSRFLFGRKTRASMTETTLATLENLVLPQDHPAQVGPTRAGRKSYFWPNGSEIIVMGFDNVERIKSLEVDGAYINEGNELTLNDYEILSTRLRGTVLPAKILMVDCNPDVPRHWLLGRVRQGSMKRFISRHKDNPRYWSGTDWTEEGKAYVLRTLESLSGVRKRRLLHGEWCAAEGQIYEMFDEAVHLVNAEDVPGYIAHPEEGQKHWNFDWNFFTIDWGKRAPGVLQAWGVIDDEAYRFLEIYRVGGSFIEANYGWEYADEEQKHEHDFPVQAWWADRASELAKILNPVVIVCDTDRPKAIKLLNDRLSESKGRQPILARPVEKKTFGKRGWLLDGVDLVQERLLPQPQTKRPSLYLVRGALVSPDPELVAQEKPTCTEEEIPEYVWRQSVDGRPIMEEPDPTCADHGCDAMRFAACYLWSHDFKYVEPPKKPVTILSPIGEALGWNELLED